MQTPLAAGDTIIRTLLREQWHLIPTHIHFIPMGDSAYSYRVETSSHNTYYLKIVDQRSATGRRTATHMNFSLPLQTLIAECHLPEVAAPLPQPTLQGACSASSGPLLFALYTFIQGETLADAYPMSPTLIRRIGQALAVLHKVTLPAALQQQPPQDTLTKPFDAGLLADLASPDDDPRAFADAKLREADSGRDEDSRIAALMAADPFVKEGVFKSWVVRPWNPLFCNHSLLPE